MMRIVLLGLSGAAYAACLAGDWLVGRAFWPSTIATGIVLLGVVFENRRYKLVLDTAPGPDWQATDERFVDPDSGRMVAVYFNPATGERRYVSASDPA